MAAVGEMRLWARRGPATPRRGRQERQDLKVRKVGKVRTVPLLELEFLVQAPAESLLGTQKKGTPGTPE